jgi:hemerythrin
MNQVKEMDECLQHGGQVQLGSIVSFLKNWFMNHIMKEDKKYATFNKIRNSSESITLEYA